MRLFTTQNSLTIETFKYLKETEILTLTSDRNEGATFHGEKTYYCSNASEIKNNISVKMLKKVKARFCHYCFTNGQIKLNGVSLQNIQALLELFAQINLDEPNHLKKITNNFLYFSGIVDNETQIFEVGYIEKFENYLKEDINLYLQTLHALRTDEKAQEDFKQLLASIYIPAFSPKNNFLSKSERDIINDSFEKLINNASKLKDTIVFTCDDLKSSVPVLNRKSYSNLILKVTNYHENLYKTDDPLLKLPLVYFMYLKHDLGLKRTSGVNFESEITETVLETMNKLYTTENDIKELHFLATNL